MNNAGRIVKRIPAGREASHPLLPQVDTGRFTGYDSALQILMSLHGQQFLPLP
jgi:hypothetical protein